MTYLERISSLAKRKGVAAATELEREASEPPVVPATPEVPMGVPAEADGRLDDDYKALALKLGVACEESLRLELQAALAEMGLRIYKMGAVTKYLIGLCPEGEFVCWKTLRKRDAHGDSMAGPTKHHTRVNIVYDHPVPYPVLLTVDRLQERFGDEISFYVSDYEAPIPDPFLLVVLSRGGADGQFIVERWDEPGFRE